MFFDELPLYSFIGEHEHEDLILGHTEVSRHYLYTHLSFLILYNGDKVIAANVSTSPANRVDITEAPAGGLTVQFTYSVEWKETADSYDKRMER